MIKYTITEILEAWEDCYGEDMKTEYSSFVDKLKEKEELEKDEQSARISNGQDISWPRALAPGPRPKLQAPSSKLQASSFKVDKTKL